MPDHPFFPPVKENEMVRFDLSTSIYRPLNQVFEFVVAPENNFQWQYGTLTSTQVSRGDMGKGSLFRAVSHLLGRRVETVYEVTVYELNKRYGFKSVSGPVDSYTLYTFDVAMGATRLNLSTETDPRGVFQPNDTIVLKKLKKEHKENLAMLKNVLEAHRIAGM